MKYNAFLGAWQPGQAEPIVAETPQTLDTRRLEYFRRSDGVMIWRQKPCAVESRDDALSLELHRDEIEPALRADVERTVRLASGTLGLDPAPTIRWLPRETSNLRGVVFPRPSGGVFPEVWLRVQAPTETRRTALHEVRHIWQLDRDRWRALNLLSLEDRQRDADRFAASWSPAPELKSPAGELLTHKTIRGGVLEVKASASGWVVAGYASTSGPPADMSGDIFKHGAWAESIATRETKLLLEHRMPIGRQLELREDAKGLFGRWSIVDTQDGTDAAKLAAAGVIESFSVGFVIRAAQPIRGGGRLIESADLYEVSMVAIPANPNAVITDFGAAGAA